MLKNDQNDATCRNVQKVQDVIIEKKWSAYCMNRWKENGEVSVRDEDQDEL
jgi:hypothetical protein